MTILLVRHGETEWNLQRRFQGRLDSPLTTRGIAQADAIGRLLAALPEAATAPIVASPQGRAYRTAEIIRERLGAGRAIAVDDRLREHSLGSWDGLTYRQIAARSPGIFDGDGRHEWYFRSPDGDSHAAFAARIGDWLAEQDERASIIAVAHGLVGRVLRGRYAGLSRAVALTLPVPQDRIFRLSAGAIEELRVQPVSADAGGRG
ncbi:MAG TPA: histidine phosphatase family protein [Stellaceae bacterium]